MLHESFRVARVKVKCHDKEVWVILNCSATEVSHFKTYPSRSTYVEMMLKDLYFFSESCQITLYPTYDLPVVLATGYDFTHIFFYIKEFKGSVKIFQYYTFFIYLIRADIFKN